MYMIQRPKIYPRNGDTVVPRVQRSSGYGSLRARFWHFAFRHKNGILFVDYLERGTTIIAGYSIALPDNLKRQLVSKRRRKLLKGIFVP
jgi:hypothetical protein